MTAKDKRDQHIQKRRNHGLTIRELGDEFGVGKSTAHRIVGKGIQASYPPNKTDDDADDD